MLNWLRNASPQDWRDAARRGVQSSLAALLTYAAMKALGLQEVYIGILSAVLILQPSIGGTLGMAWSRLQATVVGSLLGLLCLLLMPDGWGTPVALSLSLLVVGGLTALRSDWSYGVVAAVAIALAAGGDVLGTAWARALAIGLGAGIGVLVSLLVWPDRAEARFQRHFRSALRAAATRLSDAVGAAKEPDRSAAPPDHVSAFHEAVRRAQQAIDVTKLVDRDGMQQRLDALRRLYNSVIILDRATENGRPAAESPELAEEVEALRREACGLLTALAEGQGNPDRHIRSLDDRLQGFHPVLAESDDEAALERSRTAFAIGLHEVRRTLGTLLKVMSSEARTH